MTQPALRLGILPWPQATSRTALPLRNHAASTATRERAARRSVLERTKTYAATPKKTSSVAKMFVAAAAAKKNPAIAGLTRLRLPVHEARK